MREKTIREAEACDSRGWTRMTRAAFTGNIGEMKKLLDGGCDVNSQDNMGMTPLHWARTTEMMSYLIDSGANPEIRDNCGMSVLTATVFYPSLGAKTPQTRSKSGFAGFFSYRGKTYSFSFSHGPAISARYFACSAEINAVSGSE